MIEPGGEGALPQQPLPGSTEERELLEGGTVEVLGRMPWSSNATFLVRLRQGARESLAIYKPRKGERPLWDFPRGTLCAREVAAHLVSEALGWGIVPLTILRDGPAGTGMVQRFVDHDPEEHFFTLRDRFGDVFRRFALFDMVINNADRKAGHCLRDGRDHVWGIDHGVSFHRAVKLRTVIWDYEGEPIAPAELAALEGLGARLDGDVGRQLTVLLSGQERQATQDRLEWLLAGRVFPHPLTDYPYPWPMV
ncbi:MAG TPA: SCO1664 family protein [Acidimicrobiia bacterium]|nr:SCO1664 family protein [Acidimicrobiia bacterium]